MLLNFSLPLSLFITLTLAICVSFIVSQTFLLKYVSHLFSSSLSISLISLCESLCFSHSLYTPPLSLFSFSIHLALSYNFSYLNFSLHSLVRHDCHSFSLFIISSIEVYLDVFIFWYLFLYPFCSLLPSLNLYISSLAQYFPFFLFLSFSHCLPPPLHTLSPTSHIQYLLSLKHNLVVSHSKCFLYISLLFCLFLHIPLFLSVLLFLSFNISLNLFLPHLSLCIFLSPKHTRARAHIHTHSLSLSMYLFSSLSPSLNFFIF